MSFDSLTNRGEFFSNHYLDAIIAGDLGDLRRRWDESDAAHKETARSRLRGLGAPFFAARARVTEAGGATRAEAVRALNALVLEALGFTVERRTLDLAHTTVDELSVPLASSVDTGSGLLLVALDAGLADDVDDLFDSSLDASVQLLDPLTKVGEKRLVRCPVDAVGDVFATDDPPRWVVVVAGRIVLLAERAKWAEGRFLAVDLDAALERNDIRKAGEIETIAALFSTDVVVPDEGQAVIDELADKSQKHAVGVSKDLREGIRQSIEILANEVIEQRLELSRRRHDTRYAGEAVDPRELTRQCLRYLYRLLVLLYAESRPELGIVPVDDEVYLGGYSLDRLRELTLVELDTDDARNGSHLDQSLRGLFALVNDGNHAEAANALFASEYHDVLESREDYLQFPGLDALLFAPKSTELLDAVTLRNSALQSVLRLLMLSPEGKGKGRRADRGFISYAQLGINQLGAVYEGLMAYTGFFAADDLYEVAKDGDPSGGTWVVPVSKADEYPDDVFVTRTDPLTGRSDPVLHPKGSFVFRLSGRDRQRSASYYTPEVLTRCVVKHALAELLGTDDYAPENGSSGITEARQILDLTICEPALGSGAFLNEAIKQLAVEYLRRRQAELGETLDPERYLRELQKVKAHFALHQSYGVDLNATAVELAEVSLWLNCMHPGLKAPWFGLQLRRGNSLVGCRRATWRTTQLKARPWAQTAKDKVQPPVDRPLTESLEPDEFHHFLLPGHGWAAVADRSEAKEFRRESAKFLREWRKTILAAPSPSDARRLTALAAGVERLWKTAAERIRLIQESLRRPIDVWGAEPLTTSQPVSREAAIRSLDHPDSDLGRLRTLMDAWVGLWFWQVDTDAALPTWSQWLTGLEELIHPDVAMGSTDQLDMFVDMPGLVEADERAVAGRPTVSELRDQHPWLGVAVDLARREGAWHWELELAPEFLRGGFDLQVGNPPWVVWAWNEPLASAEIDPAVAVLDETRPAASFDGEAVGFLLDELASHSGVQRILSSGQLYPLSSNGQLNVYQSFLERVVAHHVKNRGTVGLVHPAGLLSDKDSSNLRALAAAQARRIFKFVNQLKLFEDVGNAMPFSVTVWRGSSEATCFICVSNLLHPESLEECLRLDEAGSASGETLPQKTPSGEWIVKGSPGRVVPVDDSVLADWRMIAASDPADPDPRLLTLHSRSEADALSHLANFSHRLRDYVTGVQEGDSEEALTAQGVIHRGPDRSNLSSAVLMSPNVGLLNALEQESNEKARTHRDYRLIDTEANDEAHLYRFVQLRPEPRVDSYRAYYKRWIDPKGERVMQPGVVPASSICLAPISLVSTRTADALHLAGFLASLPADYLCRIQDRSNLYWDALERLPTPGIDDDLSSPLALRAARSLCSDSSYSDLWLRHFDSDWLSDRWCGPHATVELGGITARWAPETALRRDVDRRQALVEIDALSALMLGLRPEHLCSMYRNQFAVLRKYEDAMAFDTEGRRICKHHQSAGYRQSQVQEQAKAGELPSAWKSVWSLYEQWEDDPDSVDWLGHYRPPFYRPNREQEMTTAYNEFQRRLDAGEYG